MFIRALFFLGLAAFTAFSQAPPPIEPGVSQSLAQWRAARYSDVRYKLNLTLEKMSPVLKGTIEIRVKVGTAPGEQGVVSGGFMPVVLDWRKISGSETLSTVANASVNGVKVTQLQGADRILDREEPVYENRSEHLIFWDGVRPGENVIKLDFTSPILTSGGAITRYVDKEDGAEYIYSLFVPSDASTAFPVFDQPDLKARFELGLNTPNGWKAVSNVAWDWVQTPDASKVHYSFGTTKPISTYVFAFAAGPFTEFADENKEAIGAGFRPSSANQKSDWICPPDTHCDPNLTVEQIERLPLKKDGPVKASDRTSDRQIYVRKSQASKFKPHAKEVFRLTREGVKYLETYFDYKFPWPTYDLVLIPEFPFGGMEHAGATFLRETNIIFPSEPTKGDYISRANVIFHETAHQWFGDTVTMRWFDDLWLKEGFAEFMAYKTLEKVMPESNAWKVFYERNKQAAYATDSTRGTTPIYQPIANLSAAKSAYGNIVYRKAPSFLRQAEFYLGEQKFQTAVRAFLKKHEYANAGWEDLVGEFERARPPGAAKAIVGDHADDMASWAKQWVTVAGAPVIKTARLDGGNGCYGYGLVQSTVSGEPGYWREAFPTLIRFANEKDVIHERFLLLEKGSGTGV